MRLALVLLLAIDFAGIWQRMTRETSSDAAARRGEQQYEAKQYDAASKSFATANAMRPTAANAFNLGTADIAAGRREEGSAQLAKSMAEPSLRAAALYNRGNSALASNAYDHAIRDYTESLRLNPRDQDAKRNLEIALAKKKQAEQRGGSGGEKGPQPKPQPQQEKAPSAAPQQGQQGGEQDAEALLRSVQQQEQEERERMKRRGEGRKVGW